jgi:hypothetical protein
MNKKIYNLKKPLRLVLDLLHRGGGDVNGDQEAEKVDEFSLKPDACP